MSCRMLSCRVVSHMCELSFTVQDCGYVQTEEVKMAEEMTRDTLVFGINNEKIKFKCILKGNSLTLQKAIEIARSEVATSAQVKELDTPLEASLDQLKRKPHKKGQNRSYPEHRSSSFNHKAGNSNSRFSNSEHRFDRHNPHKASQVNKKPFVKRNKSCFFCGKAPHPRSQCPARESRCLSCSKVGHYSSVCCFKQQQQSVHEIDENPKPDNMNFSNLFIGTIDTKTGVTTDAVESIMSEVTQSFYVATKSYHRRYSKINCKLDTGAATNVMPMNTYRQLFPPNHKLSNPTAKLVAYGGNEIPNHGSCTLFFRHRGRRYPVKFDVTDSGCLILGLHSCRTMDLIRVNCEVKTSPEHETYSALTKDKVLKDYSDTFTGIGCFPGDPYHIHLREDAVPVVNPSEINPSGPHGYGEVYSSS